MPSAQNTDAGPRQIETYRRLCNLPRLNPAATRLLALSATSNAEIEQYEEIFGSDPALAAELLTVANSAEFGIRGSAPNIRFALMLLGTDRLRSFAVTLALGRYSLCAGSSGRSIWEHSVASAVIAEELGCQIGAAGAYLYTSGLTHDLGRLGLALSGGREYAAAVSKKFSSMEEALALEKVCFGVTHCQAGEFLARSWQFPPALCRAIRRHHEAARAGQDDFLHLTQAACLLAARIGYPEFPGQEGEDEASPAPEVRGLAELDLAALRESVEKRMRLCSAPLGARN